MMEVADVAGATTLVADLALASASTALPAHQVLSTSAAAFEMASPEMAAQLARVLDAALTGGLSGVTSDQALQVVEAVEALKAWGDSISLDATAVMVTELESDFSHLAPESLSSRGWQLFLRHCRSAAAREIQVATGLPITQCQRRVWLTACEPERVASMLGAMRAGRVTLSRAITLAEATRHLDGLTAAAIMARVLRPLTGPGGVPLPGVAPLSEATFRVRLHKQLVLHHGLVGEAERTYTEAVRGRRLSTEPQRDGTGLMLISGDGPRIAAAQGRVDTIARRLRQGGDDRTLDQLRTDVATDLLMRGWIPNDPMFAALGNPPAAVVRLIVSLPTVLGVDQGVGHITGWGDVTSQQARELALQYGSIWKRVVTDPITGRAIEVSAPTYRVPAGMAEQINARDRTCRAPGCEVPGDLCDHDHSNEWELDGNRWTHRRNQPRRPAPRPPQPQDRRLLGQPPVTRWNAHLDHGHGSDSDHLPLHLRPPRQPAGQDLTPGSDLRSPGGPGHQPRHRAVRTAQHLRGDGLGQGTRSDHPITNATHLDHNTRRELRTC